MQGVPGVQGVQGVQLFPQQFPPGTYGTAPYQISTGYTQPPPSMPNQPGAGHPRPQTPPTQPGLGGPHPAMNPMMPPHYLNANAGGPHSLPPNTHSQPPPPHMQPQHGGIPPAVSIQQTQIHSMTQPKPYEKRVRKPLAIVNPDTQEVINVQPDAPASAASETASDAASSQGEAESEAKTEPDELENNNADLAEDMAKLSLDKSEESKTAEDSIPKASEASEVVTVEAVAEKQPSVEPPVVEKPELIHSEKASNDSKPVLEQHNENSLDDGKFTY